MRHLLHSENLRLDPEPVAISFVLFFSGYKIGQGSHANSFRFVSGSLQVTWLAEERWRGLTGIGANREKVLEDAS